MPSLQSLILTDRAVTPVARNFAPLDRNPQTGVITVGHSPDGSVVSRATLSLSHRKANGKMKTRMVLSVPTVQTETINGISSPRVVRNAFADITFSFSATSTEQERKDVIGMIQSSFDTSKVLINDTLIKGESIW